MGISIIKLKKENDDLFTVCQLLLESLNIDFTETGLSETLKDHVEYPSLLSLKDSLFQYGIESAAIRKGEYNYYDFETPFICSIQKESWSTAKFTIVTSADNDKIEFLDPITNRTVSVPLEEFNKIDKNIILMLDTSNPKHENNIEENKKKQRNDSLIKQIPIYLLSIGTSLSDTSTNPSP